MPENIIDVGLEPCGEDQRVTISLNQDAWDSICEEDDPQCVAGAWGSVLGQVVRCMAQSMGANGNISAELAEHLIVEQVNETLCDIEAPVPEQFTETE